MSRTHFSETAVQRGKTLLEKAREKASEDARAGKPMDPSYSDEGVVGVRAAINSAYKSTYRKTLGGRRRRGRKATRRHRKTRRAH